MQFPKRAIHLDFHTMPGIPDLCARFDAVRFARTLADAHVEFINVFAKCNLGFCYYPTGIGTPYPTLQRDLLGEMVEACHRAGIRVSAYFNLGLDHNAALEHRDWCVLRADGRIHQEDRLNSFFRVMCLNTEYGDYQSGLVEEVLRRYPVDGIFLDCIHTVPCFGVECIDAMEAAGVDHTVAEQAHAYARRRNVEYAARMARIIPKGKFLYFNGIGYRDQLPYASHFELECLPAGGWGYEIFPARVRYLRTLGKPILGMTGRFEESWGEIVGAKPEASIAFDCYHALAQGVGCSVGDHLPPDGVLLKEAYDKVQSVFEDIHRLDPWIEGAKPWTEIAVYAPPTPYGIYAHAPSDVPALWGATRMLAELQMQFDIVDDEGDFTPYRLVILPDRAPVRPALRRKLAAHLRRGGWIIASAAAGLDPAGSEYALPGWPVRYDGPEPFNVSFAKPIGAFRHGIDGEQVMIRMPGVAVRLNKGARQLAQLVQPFFNRHWDGRHGYVYVPPDKPSGRPAVAASDRIIHFSFPICELYHHHPSVEYRAMLANAVRMAVPDPILTLTGAPSFARATATRAGRRTMVHLLTYCPERRGRRDVIEDPIVVRDAAVRIRLAKARHACLAPSGTRLDLGRDGDYVHFVVPEITGYQIVEIQ